MRSLRGNLIFNLLDGLKPNSKHSLPLRKLGIPGVHINLYLRYTLFAIECIPEEFILCTSTVPYVVINNTD